MKLCLFIFAVLMLVAVRGFPEAPTLNYQGVVASDGSNVHGTGYFKFALENGEDASERFWSNDGTPGIGTEPANSVSLDVDHGLFHTELGDSNAGMVSISPVIFHQPHQFWLHTWFSTNDISFTKLAPAVRIKPEALNTINTGDLIVVDPNGSADFQDIQSAINYAENRGVVILLMPGFYHVSAPLVFPDESYFVLMGIMAERVHILNTNGAAMVVGEDVTVRSLTLQGDPALTDGGASGSDFEFDMENCSLLGYSNGCGVELSGTAGVSLSGCEIETGDSGAYAMRLRDSSTSSEFKDCEVYGSVEITNLQANIEFTDCQIVANELPSLPAVSVQNSGMNSFVNFRGCRLTGSVAPALSLSADADRDAEVSLSGCELFMMRSNDTYTIVLDNAATNDVEDVSLMIQSSEVSGWESRGAVSVSHAELEVSTSILEGNEYGVRVEEGGLLEMIHSQVEGDVAGIRAIGPNVEVELDMSTASAGGDEGGGGTGIWAEGGVSILLVNSSVNGDGSNTNAVGLRLEPSGGSAPYALLSGAVVFGEYRGLEAIGGSGLKASGSTFVSSAGIPVELREQGGNAPRAQFTSSVFMRVDDAAKPAVLLSGSTAATPLIANCQIEAPGHDACFGLDGPSSANIQMASSILSTNVGVSIINTASGESIGSGNYIIP